MKIADKISNLKVESTKMMAALKAGSGYMPLAETTIHSDGSFEMLLPDIVLGYSYLSSPKNICGDMNVFPESLKIAVVDAFWLFDSNEAIIGQVFQGSTQAAFNGFLGEKMISRWYANQNGQITSNSNCSAHGRALRCGLNLKKGWNDVVRHFHSSLEEFIYTNKIISSMSWFMMLCENSNEAQSLQDCQESAL